ncbi:hypothetical protein EG832_21570 [bacterium]|nr:hypothetical protein [bacterium]
MFEQTLLSDVSIIKTIPMKKKMEAESIAILDDWERIGLSNGIVVIPGSTPLFIMIVQAMIVNVLTTIITSPEKNGRIILTDLDCFV